MADISWETDGQKESHTITGGLDWISNWHDVERHMVELAKAWVDGQATRHLNRSELKSAGPGEPEARTGERSRWPDCCTKEISSRLTVPRRTIWILRLISAGSTMADRRKLSTDKLFKSNDKAETFGLKMGRAWADGHMLDKR